MNILLICDPKSYRDQTLDVPEFYRAISRHHNLNLFHTFPNQVMEEEDFSNHILATKIPHKLNHQDFLGLEKQPHNLYPLAYFDLVFCRTLKPFPTGYLDRLSSWEKFTKFVNSPSHKKEQVSANFLFKVAKNWIPETIVTDDWQEAQAFWEQHQTIVSKQVNSCGGRGVFKIWYEQSLFKVDNFQVGLRSFEHFSEVMDYARGATQAPLQLVRYLSQVNQGDKRIVVVDGEIYGAYIRRSITGHWVNNVSGDGECILSDISDWERDAIADTVGAYQKRGLHTLGYDFLQDDDGRWRISEINAGNIGGFARLEQLTQTPVMDHFIDWLVDFAKSQVIDNKCLV
ncbi:glutathione synthase/ribosomal protein S6 modification enzyme (glutaminyl transferase) [Xenococcus sp. PCC 7305]|uniref:ATP-grasp domain-containing protein n=1 Tax=Xenococcus sp. PCC 7305 TaxID=102125 RepID=UPI0002ABECD6|nr:YheC/YheD family protein [Xenococcus sp. PCC 7305]ELS05559.1 glutathione synthase/ribosomal protein S6 modification enzyme (glutaminyl transferase) [Xenococcus sp. PCC 7305]